jgi:hypothetical protein
MTPKEKADEIYNNFDRVIYTDQDHYQQVKSCALLAVNEIIREVPEEILDTYKGKTNFIDNDRYTFWLSVKDELEALKEPCT